MTPYFWFWIAAACMAFGSVAFLWLGASAREEEKPSYMVSFFVTLIAGTMYLCLAIGQGATTVEDRPVFYARYVTWTLTTPLLLWSLCTAGLGKNIKQYWPLVFGLIASDVYMILTGALSELSEAPQKYIWYGVSSVGFVAILVLIWGPLREAVTRSAPERLGLWNRLALSLSVLWIGYPLVWLIGPPGLALISPVALNALFVTLDVLAKVGWGFLHLFGLRDVSQERGYEPEPTRTAPASRIVDAAE